MDGIIILLVCAISLISGGVISYFVLKPRLIITQEQNIEIARKNQELADQNNDLYHYNCYLEEKKEQLSASINDFQHSLSVLEQQADDAAKIFYDKSMNIAQQNFAESVEKERQKYLTAVAEYKQQLATAMEEGASAYVQEIAEYETNYKKIAELFNQLKANTDAAVEAAKRAEAIKTEADFYKIQLSNLDLEEIHMLKNIAPYLRDQEPLNKVIWKMYYEKPTTDLIGRVVGLQIRTGIYKITNLENGKCYIGQAVNIADRWKQHIKRGLGAEPPTRNKLYPAMQAIGVERFSFEIVEECPRDQLDEREDYWQDYFKAKEFGYSIK